jgi:hypothetical protein
VSDPDDLHVLAQDHLDPCAKNPLIAASSMLGLLLGGLLFLVGLAIWQLSNYVRSATEQGAIPLLLRPR